MRRAAWVLVVASAAALAACHRGGDSGATAPSGAAQDTAQADRAQNRPPGTGLNGGLGNGTAAMGAASAPAAAAQGSKNRTTGSSVGNR